MEQSRDERNREATAIAVKFMPGGLELEKKNGSIEHSGRAQTNNWIGKTYKRWELANRVAASS